MADLVVGLIFLGVIAVMVLGKMVSSKDRVTPYSG